MNMSVAMSNSGRKINYAVRPAKNVERKMIKEVLSRLLPFGGAHDYKYIGFGSKYFSDFILFHKQLNINDMLSIESDTFSREKYLFNKPYNCIDFKFGMASDVLPDIDYDKKVIAWLDYDGIFENMVLGDFSTLLETAKSGSIIILSYNSEPFQTSTLQKEFNTQDQRGLHIKKIESLISKELLPINLEERGLSKWGLYSKFLRSVLVNQLNKTLSDRNSANQEGEKWAFDQLMYFDYEDGAKMSTVAGILYNQQDAEKVKACSFDIFEFIRKGDESYKIDIPNFTVKEVRHLLERMPFPSLRDELNEKIFPKTDVEKFSKIYRYFPSFQEIEGA